MHILFIAPHPFFQDRGTPIAVKLALEWLASAGHRVTLLTYPEGSDIELPGLDIVRVRSLSWARQVKPGFSWKKLVYDVLIHRQARRLLKQHHFDVIHSVEESVFIARWLGRARRLPYIYDMDSSLAQQMCEKLPWLGVFGALFRSAERWAIRGAIGVLPVCRAIEDIVREAHPGAMQQRLEDISLLQDMSHRVPGPDQRLDPDDTLTKLLYVGNLEKYQGIDLMLDGFALAVAEDARLRLYIVGGAATDIAHYQARSKQLGIASQVRFLGPRPASDLSLYLSQADILVSARSKGINTPMKVYSYLDSGRVVLATRMLTHTQVMDDDIACLVEPDANAMAQGMVRLARDPALRQSLADAAKIRVENEYSRSAYARKLADFYGRVQEKLQLKAN